MNRYRMPAAGIWHPASGIVYCSSHNHFPISVCNYFKQCIYSQIIHYAVYTIDLPAGNIQPGVV